MLWLKSCQSPAYSAGYSFSEGPHLSVARRGIHPAEQIRPLSDKEMQLMCRKDIGKVMRNIRARNCACGDKFASLWLKAFW